ncbi:hypothetical protein Lal_00038444 [Lupinus albus]|nr:hypothetical protein Lal_00038444 [Lupinus albus]
MQYPHTSLHGFRPGFGLGLGLGIGREEARDCPMKDKLAGCRGQEGRTPRDRSESEELACYRLTDLLSSLIGFLAWNAFFRIRVREFPSRQEEVERPEE